MNPFTTNGAFSWAELMTADPTAATAFYKSVFGWTSQTEEMSMGPYTVVDAGGISVGGIMRRPSEDIPTHWAFYVTVHDIDAVAESAVLLGGKLMMPVFEVPTVGRLVPIQDPQGAVVMAIQYAPPSGGEPPTEVDITKNFKTHGAISWFELTTPDIEASIAFYSALFGWNITVEQMDFGPYGVINVGELGMGGMSAPLSPEIPPHWGGYITVDDADAAAAAVTDGGGAILSPPMDIPEVGRFTVFQDPQGGILSAIKYAEMPT
jgi:predicted enzyme related to lactoylglutathione lyase